MGSKYLVSHCIQHTAGAACCRTRVQGVPVHERTNAHPQLLSLPMPGLCEAYHRDCTAYRPIPGGGPADSLASHWGKVVYPGNHQVNHDQDERVPPVEECTPPGAGWHTRCVPTNLVRALLLCALWLHGTLHAVQRPKGHRLHH